VGHNRSGDNARRKLRRRRKEEARLAAKQAGAEGTGGAAQGAKKPAGAGQTAGGQA
jgi:hypothetical protein